LTDLRIRHQTPAGIDAIDPATRAALANAPHTQPTGQFIVAALRRSGDLAISLGTVNHDRAFEARG
jgi:hypothetical protein